VLPLEQPTEIIYAEPLKDSEILSSLNPVVADWFRSKYRSFTPPQRMSINLIRKGENVLISSPTGTGKTLSAFLGILDALIGEAINNRLGDRIYAVYVSPLRALNNDMRRNLLEPLNEIYQLAKERGISAQEIKVGVRTSDTSPYEKQKMLRYPPHILITTPESFALSLGSLKFREKLREAKWIVVDEIHELASSKRGAHLMSSIELYEAFLSKGDVSRVGLSATVAPLEEVAQFLVGQGRKCYIADARFAKPIDIKVISPLRDLVHAPEEEINRSIYSTLVEEVMKHRTTLIFTNTRSTAERVSYKLRSIIEKEKLFDVEQIGAHHSSLGRDVRLDIEERLKRGDLKCVVSSTSLELGIDIGYIDLVVLLSSPKSVSRLLQRIGRAGHHIRSLSKGRIIVVDRDDLVECSVLAQLARERKIDRIHIPKNPLDVLVQIVVLASLMGNVDVDDLYKKIKRSYSFKELTREDFDNVLHYLIGKYFMEDKNIYPKVRVEGNTIRAKKGIRMLFFMNSGTIPDETKILAKTEDGKVVGSLEEEFVETLAPGDIFVLGGRTYEFLSSQGLHILVRDAKGRKPTVPSWFSEMLPLAYDSAIEVGKFRKRIAEKISTGAPKEEIINWISRNFNLTKQASFSIYTYILEQYLFTGGMIPGDDLILIEIYDDQEGNRNLIFHALFGRRVVEALAKAVAAVITEETGTDVKVSLNDNGFMITLSTRSWREGLNVEDVLKSIEVEQLYEILSEVLFRTEMLRRRFRHCAERSFMLLRKYKGRETSIERRQLNSQVLLQAVKDLKGFPVLKEAIREILEDYMDITHAKEVLNKIKNGEIKLRVIGPTRVPSPFSHSIILKEYSDVVLASDKRNLLATLHDRVIDFLREKGIQIDLNYTET